MCGELDAADMRRAGVFVAIGSHRLQHAWSMVSDGPVNALLTSLDCPPTVPGDLDEPVVHIHVWAAEGSRSVPDGALRSPLQFDDFIDALVRAEATLSGDRPRPVVAATAAAAAGAAPPPVAWNSLRFRLRRWPPAKLLEQSRYGVRLASFMSARPLTLDELLKLSNVDRGECERMVAALMDHALLKLEQLETPAPMPAAPAAPAASPLPPPIKAAGAPATATRPPPRSGLLAALRRRLGLTLGR